MLPVLESIDEEFEGKRGNRVRLTLRDPQSMEELHTSNFPVNLTYYTGLRRLWIRGSIMYNQPTT
jgi:hypothetical protein